MKRYRIISELGKGATGVVYRAVWTEDGSTVALKKLVLPGHLDAREEEEFIKRFKSEAEAALSIDHAGVVKVLDCGLDEGTFYIAYELVEGVTLEDALKSGREFAPDEVADIILQAADALGYAHEQGVVHRDISPGNIFLTSAGKVRIADFGVAKIASQATLTPGSEAIVGTPGYMAPEQVKGAGDADPRSDIFSLGCIAYELLTREKAFTGENLPQIIHRVLSTQPLPIRELNAKVPLALEELVFRMLAKNPDYRYQSMAEVKTAAVKVLETLPRSIKPAAEAEGHEPMLVIVKGEQEGRQFKLQPTVTTIGRTLGDILLDTDEDVSSQHAWITREEGGWVLYDADSEKGTFLHGEKIDREEILPGDRIQIGATILEFRGAGGHTGAFRESKEVLDAVVVETKAVAPPRKFPWIILALLVLPGIVLIAAGVYFGFILPREYMAALDEATDDRWVSAFETIDTIEMGSPVWAQDIADLLVEWHESPVGEAEDYMAPVWVLGHDRIDTEAVYRLTLFKLMEEFLRAVAGPLAPVTEGQTTVIQRLNAVRGLKVRIDGMEVPGGVTSRWSGRKNQLLGVLRTWEATASVQEGTGDRPASGFQAERRQAEQYLLNGWYTFREAGRDFALLEEAFNQFQLCRQTLIPVLEAHPGEDEASAVTGLAAFLAARVLRQAGGPSEPDRYTRALEILDDAETYLSRVSRAGWDRAVPLADIPDFRSPDAVLAQISALRLSLRNLLQTAEGGNSE